MWLRDRLRRDHEPRRRSPCSTGPRASSRSTSTSRAVSPAGPVAAPRRRGGRRRRAPPRRRRRRGGRRVTSARSSAAASSARARGAVRPRLAHRLVGVGRAEDPRRRARSRRRRARAGSPSRRGARGAARRSRPSGASASDWRSIRSVRYGCSRTRSHSPAPSGAGLVPDRVRDAEPAEAVHQPGAAQRAQLSSGGSPSRAPAAAASSATARAWPSDVRRLQVDEVRDRQQRGVEALAREHDGERRLGVDHRVPRADGRRGRRGSRRRRRRRASASAGSNCSPRALARERARRLDARRRGAPPRRTRRACASRDAIGTSSPSSSPGQPRPSQRSYAAPSASTHLVRQPELLAQRARDRGVVGDHVVDLAVARERELEAEPEPVQRRAARSRAGASRQRASAGSRARGRTCPTSARCRRRTTWPARGRRCGSRR